MDRWRSPSSLPVRLPRSPRRTCEPYSASLGRCRRGHSLSATASSYVATARLFLMGILVIRRVRNFPNVGKKCCSQSIAIGVDFGDCAPRNSLSALARRRERRRPCLGAADRVINRALDDDKFYHRGFFFLLQTASITTHAGTTLRELRRALNDLHPRHFKTHKALNTRRAFFVGGSLSCNYRRSSPRASPRAAVSSFRRLPSPEGCGSGMFDRLDKRRVVVASAGLVHAR